MRAIITRAEKFDGDARRAVTGAFLERPPVARVGPIGVMTLILAAVVGSGLLLHVDPIALLALIGACYGIALGLFLLNRPLAALYVALFCRLFPTEILPPSLYLVAEYGVLALALLAWILNAPYRRQPVQWNWVCLLIALYMLLGAVSLFWAPDTERGVTKLGTYSVGLFLLFLVINEVNSPRAIDGLMRVLEILGWTLALLGLYAAFTSGFHFGQRLKVFDQNENTFGLMLILMLPGVIWPVTRFSGRQRALRIALSIAYILLTLLLILLSGSRGSSLSLAILLLGFCFWRPVRPWAIVGGVLVAGILACSPVLLESLSNRFSEKTGTELGGRDVLWEASWNLIKDYPLTGMGIGDGRPYLHHYIGSLTNDYYKRDDLPSHNPFLEVGVDTGVFGMSLYFSICIAALWQFFRSRAYPFMRKGPLAAYFPIVLCATVGYFAAFIKAGGMENHPTFFLLLALLIIPSHLLPGWASSTFRPAARAQSRSARGRVSPSHETSIN
jgi:putative inorganic carbon (HCO3(-)) transporter